MRTSGAEHLTPFPSDKRGLTMGQMTERTGLSADALRYYERIGLFRPVARDRYSRHRRYSEQDCCDIAFIEILRSTAMPLHQIRCIVSLLREPKDTVQERLEILKTHEQAVLVRLAKMQENLTAIQKKIMRCENDLKGKDNEPHR